MALDLTSKAARNQLQRLARALEVFRHMDPEMQAQTMATFVAIAAHPGLSVKDVKDRLGIAGSSASRNVAALSKHHRLGKEGHDVVYAVDSLEDRRVKVIDLTPKGRKVMHELLNAME